MGEDLRFIHLGNELGITHVEMDGKVQEVQRAVKDMREELNKLRRRDDRSASIKVDNNTEQS